MKKTLNDLYKLGRTDPVVSDYLKLYEMKELTLEEALIGMVFTTNEIKNKATDNYIKHLERCATPYVERT